MRPLPLLASTLTVLALAGCKPAPVLSLESASIVASAVPDRPAVGYFTLHGGPTDQYLEFASAPYANRVEMHETVSENGRIAMRPIERVPVPAGSTVEFKPGGKHLMIFGLMPYAVEQGRTQLVLRFSDGSTVTYNAVVRRQGQTTQSQPTG